MLYIASMVDVIQLVQFAGGIIAILAALWGFYTGWLQQQIKELVDADDHSRKLDAIQSYLEQLHQDHEDTQAEISTLKDGQIAIAETVADEHNGVAVEKLRQAHYSDSGTPHDFMRSGGDSPYGDD